MKKKISSMPPHRMFMCDNLIYGCANKSKTPFTASLDMDLNPLQIYKFNLEYSKYIQDI